MITPEDIKRRAKNKILDYMTSVLYGEPYQVIEVRGNKHAEENPYEHQRAMENLFLGSSSRTYLPGYEIETEVKSRLNIAVPTRIYFPTSYDFEYFTGIVDICKFLRDFLKNPLILEPLKVWARSHVKMVASEDFQKNLLLIDKVVRWFLAHPKDERHVTVRMLSIAGVGTKFIETHERLLDSILKEALPEEDYDMDGQTFYERYGLDTCDIRMIHIKHLDSQQYEVRYLSAFADKAVKESTVILLENKETWYAFPPMKDAVAVWGQGKYVSVLQSVRWFSDKRIFYWGDIDQDGFVCLSSVRKAFPQTRSVFMEKSTLDKYSNFIVKSDRREEMTIPDYLTEKETEAFLFCREYKIILEQEKITYEDFFEAIKYI